MLVKDPVFQEHSSFILYFKNEIIQQNYNSNAKLCENIELK